MEPIQLLDIGARYGIHPRWKKISDRLHVVAFDADSKQSIPKYEVLKFETIFDALWNVENDLTLNLTRSPGASSVYLPNQALFERFPNPKRVEVIEKRQIHAKTLDMFGLHPHFIKLDTQGSELRILQGGLKSLDRVVGIEIEVQFLPLYADVPQFPDVHNFLRELDFELHDLNRLYWRDLTDNKMRCVSGDALYFRRLDTEIAQALASCYALTARQALAHAYQWVSRFISRDRPYDSDMQLGI